MAELKSCKALPYTVLAQTLGVATDMLPARADCGAAQARTRPPRKRWDTSVIAMKRRQLLQAAGLSMFAPVKALASDNRLTARLAQRRWLNAAAYERLGGAATSVVEAVAAAPSPSLGARDAIDDAWLGTLLALVQKYRLNPLRAARCFATGAVALHDAGLWFSPADEPAGDFAREVAASHTCSYMFPEEPRGRWTLELVRRCAPLKLSERHAMQGWQAGTATAQATIQRALHDGSDPGGAAIQPPNNIDRAWKAAAPLWVSRPLEVLAADWKPWLVDAAIADTVPAPPDRLRLQAEATEVLKVQQALTEAQKRVAEQWDLDLGTVTPAGVWMMKLNQLPAYRAAPLSERTAALSLLSIAMFDAFIACWKVKYRWWTERPITAIQRETMPLFMPHLVTPAHPSYVSGHATVSGAAASVLGRLFPQSATEFDAMAEEAALSRLLGGIHFRSDNEQGLALGRSVGAAAAERALNATHARK